MENFLPFWNNPDVARFRSQISESICGSGRWEEVLDELIHKGEGPEGAKWVITAIRRKDIYPLIGGKHKKWFINVQCIGSDGKYISQKFESAAGNSAKTDEIWPEVRGFVSLVSGQADLPF